MKHKQIKELLKLSLYDELSKEEKKSLNAHLKACSQCRNELDKLKKLHVTLSRYQPVRLEKTMIQDARRDLRLRIHAETAQKTIWDRLTGAIDDILSPPLQIAVGTASVLAVGILIGYFFLGTSEENTFGLRLISTSQSVMEAGESRLTNIRFLERDMETGNIEFTFETITPMHVLGNINDENVQKVLARALVSEQNTGIRLRAVNMIGTQVEQKQNGGSELDPEVRSALITALLHDKNLGVRREALNVLKHYLPDPVIVRAFLNVLANEKNAGLKIAAINSLDLNEYKNQPLNQEILDMLRHKAQSDDNNYIRIKAKAALQEVQQ